MERKTSRGEEPLEKRAAESCLREERELRVCRGAFTLHAQHRPPTLHSRLSWRTYRTTNFGWQNGKARGRLWEGGSLFGRVSFLSEAQLGEEMCTKPLVTQACTVCTLPSLRSREHPCRPCPGQRLEFGGSAAPPRLGSAAQLYGSSHPSPQTGQRGEMPVQKKQSDPSIGPNVHPNPVQETVCDLIAVRCYCLSNQDNSKRRGLSAYDATLQSLGGISVQQESLTTVTGQMTYFQFCERLPLRRISQIAKRKLASPKPTRLRTSANPAPADLFVLPA